MKAAYTALEKAIAEYEAEVPVKLSIDTEKTIQTIEPDSIFGINHRYAFNGYGTFDSKEMKMKDDFTALYEKAGFGSIRYPGGTISNLFNWKTTLGDKKDRKNKFMVSIIMMDKEVLSLILELKKLQILQIR